MEKCAVRQKKTPTWFFKKFIKGLLDKIVLSPVTYKNLQKTAE